MEYLAIEETQISNTSEEDVNGLFIDGGQIERIDLLEKALEKLLPEERGLILLYYMQEKTIEDLAHITALSISNVKTRLFRIRKKLYVLIKKMESSFI